MGAALILLAVGTIALLVWVGIATAEPARDPVTGCNAETHAAPPAHTLVLIDQTDALPQDELNYARRLILNEYHWLPVDGLLTIRNIKSDPADSTDIAVCRMPDSDSINVFTTTAEAVERDFRRTAGAQLEEFFKGMTTAPSEPRSPILEAVSAVPRRPDFGPDVTTKRLVILSDMIQNSAAHSQYGRRSRELSDGAARRFDPELTGTAVRVHYVERPDNRVQGDEHRAFWQDFFEERDAASVAIGHSLGVGEPKNRKIWYSQAPKSKAAKGEGGRGDGLR